MIESAETTQSEFTDKALRIGFPLLLAVMLCVAYSLTIVSPGLLDEQFLLSWIKAIPKLHGSSGFSGFMFFPGLDAADGWGPTTKLFLVTFGTLFGKNMLPLKFTLFLLHGCCTALTYLFSRQIACSRFTAIVATILFAFYPLHFEATGWIGGIGAELSALFFFASLCAYMHGRLKTRQWASIAYAGIFMFLAVASSTMIWSGCLAFALVELASFLVPAENEHRHDEPEHKHESTVNKHDDPDHKRDEPVHKRDEAEHEGDKPDKRNESERESDEPEYKRDLTMTLISLLTPILIVGAYLAANGGIAAALWPDLSIQNIQMLLRRSFIPLNEINWKHYSKEYLSFYAAYGFIGVSMIAGTVLSAKFRRLIFLSMSLFVLLAIPAIGLALVNSNLYGERWLYPASLPLCIFLAASISALAEGPQKFRKVGIICASILAFATFILFWRHLWNENAANRNFARVLKSAQKSMKTKVAANKLPLLFVRDLPEKISICPLYSPRGPVLFDGQSGLMRSNAVPDGRLKELLRSGQLIKETMRWDDGQRYLMPLDLGAEKAAWTPSITAEAFAGRMEPPIIFYKNIRFNTDRSEIILDPNSTNGPVITIDPVELSTIDGDYLLIEAIIDAPVTVAAPRVELHWQTRVNQHYEKRERFSYVDAIVNDKQFHRYLLSLRGNGWTTGGVSTIVALGFPAGAHVRIKSAGLIRADKTLIPRLTADVHETADASTQRFTPPYFNYPSDTQLGLIALPDNAESISASYSVADIVGATGVSIELSYPNRYFHDANSNHLSGQTYKSSSQSGPEGKITIPISDLPSSGVYSLRLIGKTEKGAYVGQFSDPLCFEVPKVRKEN